MSSGEHRTAEAAGSGLWLHAVVQDAATDSLAGIDGLAGTPVRAVRACGLAAVASVVPLPAYGEQALRRNLEDLAWLENTAREHHRVVETLARTGPVVPVRLATVHSDEHRLAAVLHEHRAGFTATLHRLAGNQEWGVKGYAVAEQAPEEQGQAPVTTAVRTGSGAGVAYLRRRRAHLSAREAGQRAAARSAVAVHEELGGHATAARMHAPQDPRLAGVSSPMLLNGAYLVRADRLAGFRAAVAALAARHPGLRLELTGPWPPYSFVDQPGGQ